MPWSDDSDTRRNNLDFLRMVLALAVIYSHSFVATGSLDEPVAVATNGATNLGEIAVWGFFAISGYLIAASWNRSKSSLDFVRRRLSRIYPGFLLCTLVHYFVIVPLACPADDLPTISRRIVHTAWDAANLRSRHYLGAFADNPEATSYNVSTWTIPYEVRCYFLLLVLGWLGCVAVGWRAMAASAVVGIVCQIDVDTLPSSLSKAWTHVALPSNDWSRLWLAFASGLIFYAYRNRIPYHPFLAIASLGLVGTAWVFPLTRPWAAFAGGAYLLFFLGFNRAAPFADFAKHGDFSYGTYLYGFPVQQLIVYWFPDTGPISLFAWAAPIAVLCGAVSWHTVEKWFVRRSPGERKK